MECLSKPREATVRNLIWTTQSLKPVDLIYKVGGVYGRAEQGNLYSVFCPKKI